MQGHLDSEGEQGINVEGDLVMVAIGIQGLVRVIEPDIGADHEMRQNVVIRKFDKNERVQASASKKSQLTRYRIPQ